MKKKIIIFITIIIIITVIILILAPRVTSRFSQSAISPLPASPPPTLAPSPTPILKIDSNSDLSVESKKLGLPQFSEDYQKLDQALSQF